MSEITKTAVRLLVFVGLAAALDCPGPKWLVHGVVIALAFTAGQHMGRRGQ